MPTSMKILSYMFHELEIKSTSGSKTVLIRVILADHRMPFKVVDEKMAQIQT